MVAGRHRKHAAVADEVREDGQHTGGIGEGAGSEDVALRDRNVVGMAETSGTAVSTGPISRGSVARVGIATALTAVGGYAVVYLAARGLAAAGFSVFAVFWGAFGLVTGAATGLLPATTREVRSACSAGPCPGEGTTPMRVAGIIGVVAAVVIAGSSPLWSGQMFAADHWLSVGLLSVGLAGFCLQAAAGQASSQRPESPQRLAFVCSVVTTSLLCRGEQLSARQGPDKTRHRPRDCDRGTAVAAR